VAKSAKSAKSDRQKVIDDIRKKQKGADQRRGFMIVGVFIVLAVVIVGAAAYRPIADSVALRSYADKTLAEIGGPASVCGEEETKSAEGSGEHVPETQQVTYDEAPPAFGPHWNNETAPVPMDRKFFTDGDRPELEQLIHNSEHGFTIVWYDQTVADDGGALNELEAVAKKFPGSSDYRYKFLAVPWTSEDGGDFPEGQHIAMTHWSIGGVGETDTTKQVGVWQYCSEFSGEALVDFMEKYPYLDSPEPNALSPLDL